MQKNSNVAFLDIIFLIALGFIALWFLSFISMRKEEKESANLKSKSEFVITMTWPKENHADVDLWVEDGLGNLVSFNRREQGLLHLERDDLGYSNDIIRTPFGEIKVEDNTEHVHIRGIVPGEVTINCHLYSDRDEKDVPVTVKAEKMNPYSVIAIKQVILAATSDEKTAFRFTIKSDGSVSDLNYLHKPLATGGFGARNQNNFRDLP